MSPETQLVLNLEALESVIERGLHGFLEAGLALALIKKHKLYEEGHRTWERYCDQRWGFSDRRARQLIDAAHLVENLRRGGEGIGTIVPKTEYECRQLGRLPRALQRVAWLQLLGDAGPGVQPAGPELSALVTQMMQSLTPEQQRAAAEQDRARAREHAGEDDAPRPVNWPRKVVNAERTFERLAEERPDVVQRFGAQRLRHLILECEQLAAALECEQLAAA